MPKAGSKRDGAVSDEKIVAALLRSAVPMKSIERNWAWEHLRIDATSLTTELIALIPPEHKAVQATARTVAHLVADQYELRKARVDSLNLNFLNQKRELPRTLVGEALGAFGSSLFHTRRRSRLSAAEIARELAYFGYGTAPHEMLSPLTVVRDWLSANRSIGEPVLLEEQSLDTTHHWTPFALLSLDPLFHGQPQRMADVTTIQERLRADPLNGAMVSVLREYFSRRATIGVRDTVRWALGSRHPWFDWPHARDLIRGCFKRHGTENFFAGRTNIYVEDPEIPAAERARVRENNRRAVTLFADELGSLVRQEISIDLPTKQRQVMAALVLDYHHDYPDYDLETLGNQRGVTGAHFLGHAGAVLASHLRGDQITPRRNGNMAGLFSSLGLNEAWLSAFDDQQRERFYAIVGQLLETMHRQGGLTDGEGLVEFQRVPMILVSFCAIPLAQPRPEERVLESFRLSQLRAPRYAGYLRSQPELIEKLVVFFTLVLRHYLDSAHLPRLLPENWLRDYWLLGLWGTCAENVWVNLYHNETSGTVRCEVRFRGGDHQKVYRPDTDAPEAALLHKAVAALGPDPEQGILRALASFLMALQENHEGSRSADLDRVAIMKQTLEVFRETARSGVRGTLVDLAATFEVLMDTMVDRAQRGLARVDRLSRKPKARRAPRKDP